MLFRSQILQQQLNMKLDEGQTKSLIVDGHKFKHLYLVAMSTGRQERTFIRNLQTILDKAVSVKATAIGLEPFGTPAGYGYPMEDALTTLGEQICTWVRNRSLIHDIEKYIIYVGSGAHQKHLQIFLDAFVKKWKEEEDESLNESEGTQAEKASPVDEDKANPQTHQHDLSTTVGIATEQVGQDVQQPNRGVRTASAGDKAEEAGGRTQPQ